jgi:hypothetical protein
MLIWIATHTNWDIHCHYFNKKLYIYIHWPILFSYPKGCFTHKTKSPWPLHFKLSHWWKRRSRSKFTSFTLPLRDQHSMWMQDGCKVYMASYMASNGSCFMVTWTIFKNHLLEVWLTQNRETMHGTPNAHNRWFIPFYHAWGLAWREIHSISIWLRARSHMTSHYTWRSVTTLHNCGGVLGRPLDTFLLGSHNNMVTALGLCGKWP